jgi:hypothetical protein
VLEPELMILILQYIFVLCQVPADFTHVYIVIKSHAACQNQTRACGIAASENPI